MLDSERQRHGLIEGLPGESLFCHAMMDWTRYNELPELFRKVEGMNDERLLAIVTALIVENRLDHMLPFFLPRYSKLKGMAEFTFSMKIRLLQALNFIPPLIPAAAHCIREIRNEFAHQLSKTQLSEIDPKVLSKLNGIYQSAYAGVSFVGGDPVRPEDKTLKETFRRVTFFCVVGLNSYAVNLRILREHISKPGLVEALGEEAVRKSMEWYQQMQSGTPIRVEQQGDKIIEHFESGFALVRGAIPDGLPVPPPASTDSP